MDPDGHGGTAVRPDARQLAYLRALGIPLWVPRPVSAPAVTAPAQSGDAPSSPENTALPAGPATGPARHGVEPDPVERMDWAELRQAVSACQRCGLHATRRQTVFGAGDVHARWLFIGEAPGADEDRQGEPFVGRAGQLLTAMIRALGQRREEVYIANILKCRPPRNRDPEPGESRLCRPYLRRQIALLSPGIIVTLGRVAAQNLLQTEEPISRLRARRHEYEDTGIPVVATYHPAYLLRSPTEKRKAWDDLRLARTMVTSG